MKSNNLLFPFISSFIVFAPHIEANVPHLSLANVYSSDIQLSDYYVSEKYDGIRAYWDGNKLYSRQGNIFDVPQSFLEYLPDFAVDGELFLRRGGFQELISIIKNRHKRPDWEEITYRIFDTPAQKGDYDKRLAFLHKRLTTGPSVKLVEQFKVANEDELYEYLRHIESLGGEGVMLHQISGDYIGRRSDQLLKLKSYADEEAIVLGILEGKGKYQGMMGALWVKNRAGKVFKIGSGFSDSERRYPPKIGAVLTYRYNGVTDKGIPKFARFLKVRDPLE